MKYLLVFLFSLNAFAQDTLNTTKLASKETEARAVVAIAANIVYRGIDNKISIAVMGVDAGNVSCSAPGSFKSSGKAGQYIWNVTSVSGTTAALTIVYTLPNGERKVEVKDFEIKNIGRPYPYIGKYHSGYQQSYNMTRQDLANIELNSKIDDFTVENKYLDVESFTLYLPKDTLFIKGNTLPENMKDNIYSLQTGTQIIVEDITRYNPHSWCFMGLPPLTIEIVDDPLPIEPDDLPRPIIFNTRYETVYRGMGNNFSISVPGAKSYTVSGPGVKQYSNGSFDLTLPGDYKENLVFVDVEAIIKTDSVVKYNYMYIAKNIETRMLINGQGCEKCIVQQNLADLKNAVISVEMPDVSPFNTTIVRSFKVILPDGGEIQVKGNRISAEALYFIEFLEPGEMIIIDNIYYHVPGVQFYNQKRYPIKIMLIQ